MKLLLTDADEAMHDISQIVVITIELTNFLYCSWISVYANLFSSSSSKTEILKTQLTEMNCVHGSIL